jgi:hypothetical protein
MLIEGGKLGIVLKELLGSYPYLSHIPPKKVIFLIKDYPQRVWVQDLDILHKFKGIMITASLRLSNRIVSFLDILTGQKCPVVKKDILSQVEGPNEAIL